MSKNSVCRHLFMDEKRLIAQAKEDKDAFGRLYETYVERIYNYVYYRTGNHADAQDLTARIFERAMKHIVNYEDKGVPFSAWLYRIAHNLVANHHRDRSRKRLISLDDVSQWQVDALSPESEAVILEDREKLLRVIRRLPADRQELLILKFVDRLSNAEIGGVMGRSEGAIKSLYHRTLIALREEWEADGALPQPRSSSLNQINKRWTKLTERGKRLKKRFE